MKKTFIIILNLYFACFRSSFNFFDRNEYWRYILYVTSSWTLTSVASSSSPPKLSIGFTEESAGHAEQLKVYKNQWVR